MAHTVVKRSRIASYPPWTATAVAYLPLDRFHAPGWVWGVTFTLFAIVWFAVLYAAWTAVERDPFPGSP